MIERERERERESLRRVETDETSGWGLCKGEREGEREALEEREGAEGGSEEVGRR